MATSIKKLKGATDSIIAKLKEKGIDNADELLSAAADPKGRQALAQHCGCDARDILELANRADLSRIKGVSGVYSDLLEKAGVDTVKELAMRRADNLHTKIVETNKTSELTKRPPTAKDVESWVSQAKDLPKLLTY